MRRLRRLGKDERIELLRSVELLSRCSRAELARIAALTSELRAEPGEVLTRQGEPGSEFFLVLEGTAAASRDDVHLATLEPGSFFGEVALLDGGGRTATVTARTGMRLLVMSRREFFSLHAMVPSVSRRMLGELGARLRRTNELLRERSVGVSAGR
jgi:CRP/FNR family transcriptional regulator, cyclic AMP receptor protein